MKVIGSGLLASAFRQAPGIPQEAIIFASGVSNSKETKKAAFAREQNLLEHTLREAHATEILLYFSTISIYDPILVNSQYVAHKLSMEALIRQLHPHSLIIRAPNIIGSGGNPKTMINFFRNKVHAHEPISIWQHATRNFLDVDDLIRLTAILLRQTYVGTVNLMHPVSYSIQSIIGAIEQCMGIVAKVELINKGSDYCKEVPLLPKMLEILKEAELDTGEGYLLNVLKKYDDKTKGLQVASQNDLSKTIDEE